MNETPSGRLSGRTAVITGASRGIGAAVARRFGAEGAQLILIARTQGGLEEVDDAVRAAGGLPPTLVPHDLRDGDGIDRLGAALYERYAKLDILVGNAAQLGALSPTGHIAPKVWEEVMAVNVTANFRLLRSLDPLLRRSEAGRAIFVTDRIAAKSTAFWAPYAASKAALEALVESYAAEVASLSIRVNLISPPATATALRAQAYPGEDQATLAKPESLTEQFVALAEANCSVHGECHGCTAPG